jgi:plastocyanin
MSPQSRSLFWLACAVILILACFGVGCYSAPAPSATTAPAPAAGANVVMIRNFAFSPATLTVRAGTTVTWTNDDSPPHAIASDAGSPVTFSSSPLANGATFSFTFTQAGSYPYHCSIHPSMKGTIIVES